MKVLALDPGLQRTGWAVFAVPRAPRSFNDALKGLLAHGAIETSSSDPMHARLASIGLQVRNLLIIHDPVLVYVEVPSFHGNYGDNPGRRRSTNKLYQALGAILGRMSGQHVVSVPAIRQSKDTRNDILEAGAEIAKVELPYGARGGIPQDTWDAIWLGTSTLEQRASRDLHEARAGVRA